MSARVKALAQTLRAIREHWASMERRERHRVLVHGGCVAWLGSSFAHEWHAIGQADIAFLVLSLVCEWDNMKGRG